MIEEPRLPLAGIRALELCSAVAARAAGRVVADFRADVPGALDHQTRLAMGDELLRLWRQTSATVLLITHALDEAAMLSDRVGVMSARPGRLIDVITTRWPRQRDSRIISDPSFARVTARIWNQLHRESLRAIGSAPDQP